MNAPASPAPALAVCIGRFQILHNGQLAIVRRALALAPRCVVVIGSAFQAPTVRNPFTWQERAETLRLALPEADRERIVFVPVRDYYDQAAWVKAVRDKVAACTETPGAPVVLVGHRKDATSEYLGDFPGWTFDDPGRQGDLHATALRDVYFAAAGHPLEPTLAALVSQVPPSTVDFLRAWALLPFYATVAAEWLALRNEKARWAGSPYTPMFVTVDAVLRCAGKVLLIRRGRAPGKGLLAVPGGFLEARETVYQSALRELAEETGLRLLPSDIGAALRAVHVFDHPDRSQRGRVITHAHYFDLGDRRPPEVAPADDAAEAVWLKVEDIAGLEDQFHDDHFHMLDFFFGVTGQAAR